MPKASPPELRKYMDKNVIVKLNANRSVTGVLRGFDTFMNIVISLQESGNMAVRAAQRRVRNLLACHAAFAA